MQNLQSIVVRDATLCAAMTDELEDYIKSNTLFWEPNRRRPGGADLPKLTLGGLLLAACRLTTLRDRLAPDQVQALDRTEQELAVQKPQWITRYRDKLARDLRSRLDAWAWYLDDCQQQGERAIAHYARQVETRVKIDLLLEEAKAVGLEAQKEHQRRAALDQRLRADFVPGDFCWPGPLAAGFSMDRFWYLYGRPREK